MSSGGRQSPRAAIRDWLSHNEPNSRSSRPRHDVADDPEKERRPRERHRSKPDLEAGEPLLQLGSSRPRNRQDTQGDQLQKRSNKITTGRLDGGGVSLAERLNLHAPFRSFGSTNDFEDLNDSRLGRARKRRRSPSSTSSDLEPAALPVEPLNAKMNCAASSEHKRLDIRYDTASQSPSQLLQSSSATFVSPERAIKSYERRPRHKTKENRYELKQHKAAVKHKREKKDRNYGEDKKIKKSKLHKKSGGALVHDFAAHNVAQDRLTLKPPISLGLFKKGRASSPVRRRGLPDLTFSEMTFLNPRQDRPEDIVRSTDQKKGRKNKTADTEAEISRYFASAKAREVDATTAKMERARSLETSRQPESHRKRSKAEKFANLDRSSLPPIELPERPFLGFGSVGGSLISPVRRSEIPGSSIRQSDSIQRDLSPTRSTSYFSWAKTRSPSHRSSRPKENENGPPVVPKRSPIVGDLVADGDVSQQIVSGVSLPSEDNTMDKRDTRDRKTSHGRREGIVTVPDDPLSNDPQEQNLEPPLNTSDLLQRQAQNVEPALVERSKTPQHQQTAAEHGSNDHNARADPTLTKLNDPKSKRPEDLINATLKLLLEKYGANPAGPSAAAGVANESPKSRAATTNDSNSRVSTHHVPSPAKDEGGEAMDEDSNQGGGHGMTTSPGPFPRRTAPHETRSTGKPSRHENPSEDVIKVSPDTQGAAKGSQATQGPPGSLHPSQSHRTDAKSAWNGYDAIYERQFMSEEFQSTPYGNQVRDESAVDRDMMYHPTATSEYGFKDKYGSGFHEIYDDCSPGNPNRSNAYNTHFDAQSYQGQVHTDGMRGQQLDESYCYARPFGALDERFLNGENGYLLKEELPFVQYTSAERGRLESSMDWLGEPSCASQDSGRGHLPFQRKLRDEPPRALYSRPHTQSSSHSSVQHNLVSFPDQIDNTSLSGFWKPHRLY